MRLDDALLSAAEVAARHVYWRSALLQHEVARWRERSVTHVLVERARLRDHLEELGVREHPLVMMHTGLRGLSLLSDDGARTGNPLAVAALLLADIMSLVPAPHTLSMPCHPLYREDPEFMRDKAGVILDYCARTTPSRVGLVTQLFLSRPGVRRSAHPLSSLAVLGAHADMLLKGNLNEARPLPHGIHSGYYRFCTLDGLVVSIGVPLIKAVTILHVAEEVRDAGWPVRDFFCERRFRVQDEDATREWTVRERRPEFVRSLALGQVRRDLLREGILRETLCGGLQVDTASAGELFRFMQEKNSRSTYPYYFPGLSRLGRRGAAA